MASAFAVDPLERFYRDVLHELGRHARRRDSTVYGFGVVVKRLAQEYGLDVAEVLPLPRPTRSERETAWEAKHYAPDA
ncbi:MAG TPA: hypothetical protein VEH29_18245 [Acidimicrobiales bacterium]|nr:hypothetical protein [Acidimicrobiales bacterium]